MSLAQQFLCFACVVLAATGVHYATLVALVQIWQIHPAPATTLGFVAGAFVSYVLNRRYTFKASGQVGLGLAKYYEALSAGLALNAIIVAVPSSEGRAGTGDRDGRRAHLEFSARGPVVFRDAA